MGGPGSGSWVRPYAAPRCESYRRLDIRQWPRSRQLYPGYCFSWVWSTPEGAMTTSILVSVMPTSVRLTYRYRGREDTWQDIDDVIELTSTPQPYGGTRPWFRCPCGQRVAILYGAGAYFRCRHCYHLRYQTEAETPPFRQQIKAQKIRERLGGRAGAFHPFPNKPRRMRWTTYHRLESAARDAELAGLCLALAHNDRVRRRR
jgi:hypothetical protein